MKSNKEKWVMKGYSKEELEKKRCPNGNFTCGLMRDLGRKTRCIPCRQKRSGGSP